MLPPTATTALWQRASGAWELAAPTVPSPDTAALGPLWIATTDAASVTELLGRRVFVAETIVIHLRGDLPAAPGPIAETLVVHDGLVLEDVLYCLSGSGEGSAGQTQLDLLLDEATLYPSFIHELTELHPGQLLQLVSIEIRPAAPPPGRRPISYAGG